VLHTGLINTLIRFGHVTGIDENINAYKILFAIRVEDSERDVWII
jgi:hypothetical protein